MTMTYVLIDYENVQPGSLEVLDQEHYKTLVFVGAGQSRFVFGTVAAFGAVLFVVGRSSSLRQSIA